MATDAIIKTNVKYGSYFWVQWSVREQDAARNKTVILWSCGLHPEEQYYTNAIRMSAVVIFRRHLLRHHRLPGEDICLRDDGDRP